MQPCDGLITVGVAAVAMAVGRRGLAVVAAIFSARHLARTVRTFAFHQMYLRPGCATHTRGQTSIAARGGQGAAE